MKLTTMYTRASRAVADIFGRWRRQREQQQLRYKLVGRPETEADRLAAHAGRTLGLNEVALRLGLNTRRMLGVAGVNKMSSNPAAAMLLAEIGQACAQCPDWERCKRWLEAGAKGKAYLEFCPNVARFAELKARAAGTQSAP